ncbi:uncharacterized protein EI90DRAFT_3076980 [Cantharellus anzutake]|uniref:uncharacterized protein n=1 Tax=Cantharellus anzutake TaxID=1750568 RepID=UPI0019047FD9|nr:uncharacterized protein EI90DRAFT_3076980 [Cantharellus anzutake]KAF8323544.1 hypothetical protein EI90DRAFT_3076980 [Cantharellus anzutake]
MAFRLDSNVDRVFSSGDYLLSLRKAPQATTELVASAPHNPASIARGVLTTSSISESISFAPLVENLPVPIQHLPTELLVYILRFFSLTCNYTALERFGAVCKKARVLTMDNSLWRDIVRLLYQPPQIPKHAIIAEIVNSSYGNDYRRTLILHPRVRFDGVYIAVCHCMRPGFSDNAWVNVSHLVTYHRYLRFFQDGSVLSLLANEDNPSDVVQQLKTSIVRSGLCTGRWHVIGSEVFIHDLFDSGGNVAKYAFEMSLALRSKPLGRWNKLEMTQYQTKRVDTGEIDVLPLKNERPFWFSKVRSYHYCHH